MRKAEDFVEDYRRKGYPDDRIRIIASMRPEPLRTEVLKLLGEPGPAKAEEPARQPAEVQAAETPLQEKAEAAEPKEAVEEGLKPDAAQAKAAETQPKADKAPKPAAKAKPAGASKRKPATKTRRRKPAKAKRAEVQAGAVKATAADAPETEPITHKPVPPSDSSLAGHAYLHKTVDILKQAVEQRDDEITSLQSALDEQEKHAKRLAEEAKQVKAEAEPLRAREKKLDQAIAKLTKAKAAAEKRTEEIAAKHAVTEVALSKVQGELDAAKAELADGDEKIARLQGAESAAAEAATRVQQLTDVEARLREERKELGTQMEILRLETQNLREKLAAAKEEESEFSARIEELDSANSQLERQADTLREELKTSAGAADELRQKLDQKGTELASLRAFADREAAELRKRMEMEMRQSARQVSLHRKLAAAAASAAALILFCAIVFWPGMAPQAPALEMEPPQNEKAAEDTVQEWTKLLEDVPTGADAQADPVGTGASLTPSKQASRTPPVPTRDAPVKTVEPAGGETKREPPELKDPAPAARPKPTVIHYTVQKGDRLWTICRDVLGDSSPKTVNRVARENNLEEPSRIRPGMKLKLRKIKP